MACYAVVQPIFQPAMRLITAITNANPAAVTTSFDHDYISGTIVRLYVPIADGMYQIDKKIGTITVTGLTTFTIDIDTTTFDVFAIPVSPSPHTPICAQVVPIGEINSTLAAATQNVLPFT